MKSDATAGYNCISWALTYDKQTVWPDEEEQFGWPPDLPRDDSVQSFRQLFERCGFAECANGDHVRGVEKIALLGKNAIVLHATRQLPSGIWTSKLGQGPDGEHPAADSLGQMYGVVLLYMSRIANGQRPVLPRFNPPPALLVGPNGNPLIRG